MKAKAWGVNEIRAVGAALGAALVLALLLLSLAAMRTQAAPLSGPGTDPQFRAITMTADLPCYDPAEGAGITKTVYFSNGVAGTISMTFDISGTPALTLAAGAAFGTGERVYTATGQSWTRAVTYAVAATHTTQSAVAYTAVNMHGDRTSVAITYVRDVTAPAVSIACPPEGAFTGTQLVLTGTAQDNAGGAGVRRVQVLTGTAWETATGTAEWAYTGSVPIADGVPLTLAVRAEDFLGSVGLAVTRVITVDNVPPTGTVVLTPSLPVCQWVHTPTLHVRWDGFSDGGGLAGYQYLISTTPSLTLPQASGVWTTANEVTETVGDGEWTLCLAARDLAGNWSATRSVGLFHVDLLSPTVVIGTPLPGAVLTTALASVPIAGAALDAGSGVTQVRVTTGTAWAAALGTSTWVYTWTLPVVDNVTYTLAARASDDAGNEGVSPGVPVTVDTVAPAAGLVLDGGEWSAASTLVFTWAPSSDAAGIAGYSVLITTSAGMTVADGAFVTAPAYTLTGAAEGAIHYARIRAWDGHANVGGYGSSSDGIAPDLSPPLVGYGAPPIDAASAGFYAAGPTVYYHNVGPSSLYFTVQGTATDTLSGAGVVTATPALGTPSPGNVGTWKDWAFTYRVPPAATASGRITVTASDGVGHAAAHLFTYTHDALAPIGGVLIQGGAAYAAIPTVTLALSAADNPTGCGVAQMCVGNSPSCSSWEPYASARSWLLAGGDGEKSVYVSYRDHLHNSSGAFSATVFLDTASPVVTVTAPAQTTGLAFPVSWGASDPQPGSGVVSYTVMVRQEEGSWSAWLASTTLTQATFVSATLDHTYLFSITAHDRAGNRGLGSAATRVALYRVYLPLVLRNWTWWYAFDGYEPNDTPAQAYGPLASTQVYTAYIWDGTDVNDYYHFTPATTGQVQITLSHIPAGCDYDLYVYYYDGQYRLVAQSNLTGNQDEGVTFQPVAGRKHTVRVYPFVGSSSQQAYHLQVAYGPAP